MNPLLQRLAVVRRRYRLVTMVGGICATAAFVIGSAVFVGLVDWYTHLPRLLRAAALVSILAGTAALVVQLLVVPLARRSDNLSLALRIEAIFPELNDALASTVQFLEQPDSPLAGDPRMRERAIERATSQARSFDFHQILDYRFLWLSLLALVGTVATGAHFRYREPELSRTALLRLVEPFGPHTWTRIDVPEAITRLAVGQPFRIKANVDGILPTHVKIEVQAQNPFNQAFENRPELVVPVKSSGSRSGAVAAALDVSQKPLKFRYRISGNDGSFPPQRRRWHEVSVLQPPSFAMIDHQPSPQIELRYPAYTGLPSPQKLSPGTRHLEMIQGTEVMFRAAVDRPLKEAAIELRPRDGNVRLATYTGLLAMPDLLPQIGLLGFHSRFSWNQPVRLDEARTSLQARFRPWIPGSYVVRLEDDNDLVREYESELRVLIDPVPHAHLQRPVGNQSYLPTAEVPFRTLAEDDVYAVRSVYLEYRRKNPQGDWLDAAPQRLTLYEPRFVGETLRAATHSWLPFEALLPVRTKRLELAMLWSLKKQFKVGDIVAVQMCADDFCDVFTPRLPGRSQEVELRIVSRDDLERQLDENLAEVQKELVALRKVEEEAQKLLEELPKDKADARALDQVLEAAQKARQVQERIGTKSNEGIRDKLEKMQQMMKDNKLPGSEMQDQVRGLTQELERLVQEEFPKLEQNLNELRKEMAGAAKPQPKEQKSPLEKSKETNREIQKTLDELTRELDRWADLAQLKGQTRELIEKQKTVAGETEKLKESAEELRKNDIDEKTIKNALKSDLDKVGGEQKKVEQETRELLDKIAKSKERQRALENQEQERAEEGDKDARQRAADAKDAQSKLKQAQDAAKKGELQPEMKAAGENLKDNRPNAALEKQKNAVKTLEKMLSALEGKKDDDLDRLRKKQKDVAAAQNDLDRLQKNLKKHQDAQKQPGAKADPKQHAKELREDAEDLRDQARQLQRLQEQKAARELQRAADLLEQAAKKAEAGEPAEELEQEARERIEQAMEQLEHLRQELAREQLARIGDRLKGLKERQDAAVERTKELHSKVIQRNQWSRGLVQTLDADRQTQKGLADETQGLEEKLKGAMVFEHILKKAGRSMVQASDAMAERHKSGVQRQIAKFEKDEMEDENRRQNETLKLQKQAADRLDRLLDALKDAQPVARKDPPKKEEGKKNPDGKEEPKEEGGMRAQDGVPPMAQIKALKAEQIEVHERTKEFAQRNPNVAALNEAQLRELRELFTEQDQLRRLFGEMTKGDGQGGQP